MPETRQRALVLNGGRTSDDGADAAQEWIRAALAAREWDVDALVLRTVPIAYCQGCFDCWVKTPGECKIDDAGRDVANGIIHADMVALVTPITFGGYSYDLKKALDRVICLISPFFRRVEGEVHHRRRYDHYPRLLAVGIQSQADDDEASVFSRLVHRNAINFHALAHGVVVIRPDEPEARARVEAHAVWMAP